MSLSLVEINRGANQKLFEVSGFSKEIYDLPHKVLRAVGRVPLDEEEIIPEDFTDVSWDCIVGFVALGNKEDMERLFAELVELLGKCLDQKSYNDFFDIVELPQRMALMEPVEGIGPYVIIGDAYIDGVFNQDFGNLLESYTEQNKVWWTIIGAEYNDLEAVPTVVDVFEGNPSSPFANMWIAFLSSGLQGVTYKDEWQLWYADEEFDVMRERIEEFRTKNSIDI